MNSKSYVTYFGNIIKDDVVQIWKRKKFQNFIHFNNFEEAYIVGECKYAAEYRNMNKYRIFHAKNVEKKYSENVKVILKVNV